MLPYQGEQGSGSTRRTPAIHANYTSINAPTPEVWGQRTRTPRARILASHTRLTCAMKPTWPGDAAAVSSTAASRTRAADVNALPHVRTMGAGGSHLLVRPSGAGQYCASFAFGVRVELSSRFPSGAPPPTRPARPSQAACRSPAHQIRMPTRGRPAAPRTWGAPGARSWFQRAVRLFFLSRSSELGTRPEADFVQPGWCPKPGPAGLRRHWSPKAPF